MVARILAVLILSGALLCIGAEAVQWVASGRYDTFTGGELWYALDRASLRLVQAGVEHQIAPWIWDPLALWFLMQPAWLLLGAPALLVLWLKQPKLHPRFLRRRIFAPTRKSH